MERITPEDRRKFIRLGPDPVFVVTEDNDAGLGAAWKQMFIPLDCEDTHCEKAPFSWTAQYLPRVILQ
jgi:hypothetical protein